MNSCFDHLSLCFFQKIHRNDIKLVLFYIIYHISWKFNMDTQHDAMASVLSFMSIQIVVFCLKVYLCYSSPFCFKVLISIQKRCTKMKVYHSSNFQLLIILIIRPPCFERGEVYFLRPFLKTAFKEAGFMVRFLKNGKTYKLKKNKLLNTLRIQVCPKEGIISTILFWGWDLDHQSYSREGETWDSDVA